MVYRESKGFIAYTKGAPEVIVNLCSGILESGRVQGFSPREKKRILSENSQMTSGGLRVLGLAYRRLPELAGRDLDLSLIHI